ncbi:hypothetical protein EMCRGX_G019689 [Ephydatia muelleri]|eukprot:Em0011g330a
MKSLNSVVACFLLIMYANLVRGGIPKTRSAPCIRGVEACMQGSGVTERRALINGFNAIKKLLQRQVFVSTYDTLSILGKMEQYKYLIQQFQNGDDTFANNTKLSIYSAVLDGVTTAACSYINTFVGADFRINCTDPAEVSITLTALGLVQDITNTENSLPSVDCLDSCQWIKQNIPEELSTLTSNLAYCR